MNPNGKIVMERRQVGPYAARALVANNTHNRNINRAHVGSLARAITRGFWQFNGDAIRVAENGAILDGQHRLLAVIEADKPIDTVVITGLSAQTQETMDLGRKRRVSDALQLRGHRNAALRAAVGTQLAAWEDGLRRTHLGSARATSPEIIELIETEPLLDEAVERGEMLRHAGLHGGPGLFGMLFCVLGRINVDEAREFFDKLATGEQLALRDPILLLRNRLILQPPPGAQVRPHIYLELMIRAWNARREGRTLAKLQLGHGDQFPEPH